MLDKIGMMVAFAVLLLAWWGLGSGVLWGLDWVFGAGWEESQWLDGLVVGFIAGLFTGGMVWRNEKNSSHSNRQGIVRQNPDRAGSASG